MIRGLVIIGLSALMLRLITLVLINYYGLPTLLSEEKTKQLAEQKINSFDMELGDASDPYYTSIDLQPPEYLQKHYGYKYWWQRNPLHVFVLHITGRSVLFQILLSVVTVLMLYKINKIAGIIYAFYPQAIIYSCMFTKVTLWVFLFVLSLFLFKDSWKLLLSTSIIMLFFVSIFNFVPETQGIMTEFNRGYIDKVVGLWQPSFNHTPIVVGNWIQYIQAPFYLLLMFLFVKYSTFNYISGLVILFTLGAAVQYAHPFHREPLIPLILVDVCNKIYKK